MIFEILQTGKQNARTVEELSAVLKISPRQVRERITAERKAGVPICSSPFTQGYYKPSCDAEIREFIKMEASRIRTALQVLAPFLRVSVEEKRSSREDAKTQSSSEL